MLRHFRFQVYERCVCVDDVDLEYSHRGIAKNFHKNWFFVLSIHMIDSQALCAGLQSQQSFTSTKYFHVDRLSNTFKPNEVCSPYLEFDWEKTNWITSSTYNSHIQFNPINSTQFLFVPFFPFRKLIFKPFRCVAPNLVTSHSKLEWPLADLILILVFLVRAFSISFSLLSGLPLLT